MPFPFVHRSTRRTPARVRTAAKSGRFSLVLCGLLFAAIGCTNRPDLSHYVTLINQLSIPAGWELAHEAAVEPDGASECDPFFGGCPSITRIYLVRESPVEIFPIAEAALSDAALEIRQAVSPECDTPPSTAACFLVGRRDSDEVRISIFNPGQFPNELGIEDVDRSVVVVTAQRGRGD